MAHGSTEENDVEDTLPWVAIEPLRPHPTGPSDTSAAHHSVSNVLPCEDADPPGFQESRFDVVLRRQRTRRYNIKQSTLPSRFIHLSGDFLFAGWGSKSTIQLTDEDSAFGTSTIQKAHNAKSLGQFLASALAGNAVLGSVFYSLPAVFSISGVYSPISLLLATMTLFLWRPIMNELASALPIRGAPYSYILNVSTKGLALGGAALLVLDFASTSVVSAATASTYLSGEVSLPFPAYLGGILVFILFMIISLSGIKESARLALSLLSFHMATMAILTVAAIYRWIMSGSHQLDENWTTWNAMNSTAPRSIARQIFDGFCLGTLGLTGFVRAPAYIARIRDEKFPAALRNLHYPAIFLNVATSLFTLAIVPLEQILSGANILSLLAEMSGGRWLRIWIVVDAFVVLCGGVLTGILSACELLEQLALDRVVPRAFLRLLPITFSPYVSTLSFTAFSGILYASVGANLSLLSKLFSIVWLCVMMLFPLTLLLLNFNRRRLSRKSRTPLNTILLTIAVGATVFSGNVAIDPTTLGYFSIYFIVIVLFFSLTQMKSQIVRLIYWAYDQYPILHSWKPTEAWGERLIQLVARLRRQPVCILVKSDEINHLFRMISYVENNEDTSFIKLVNFVDAEKGVPSELEANAKILDEAFPGITIDLVLVSGSFDPVNVCGLAHRLNIPTALMFMSCPGESFPYRIADFGTRIISL